MIIFMVGVVFLVRVEWIISVDLEVGIFCFYVIYVGMLVSIIIEEFIMKIIF